MGVTDVRPSFTQIIGHNSKNVHRFLPNVVLRSTVMSPLSVPNFRAYIGVLWQILQSV